MSEPIISVVLPVRNGEKYIEFTLDSILSQTFGDFELIVVNDASQDSTKRILEKYASLDNRIRVIENKVLMGMTNSMNRGITASRGRYIARMDAGDIALPDRFNRQVRYMEQNKDISVLGGWAYLINKERKIIGEWKVPAKIDSRSLYEVNGVIHPSVLMRKDVFDKIGKYDSFYKITQDFELWARALKNKYKISNLHEFLIYYMEEEGYSSKYFITTRRETFIVKLKYLFCFFNIRNLLSTLRSFTGCFLPSRFTKYLAHKYSETLTGKTFKGKDEYVK